MLQLLPSWLKKKRRLPSRLRSVPRCSQFPAKKCIFFAYISHFADPKCCALCPQINQLLLLIINTFYSNKEVCCVLSCSLAFRVCAFMRLQSVGEERAFCACVCVCLIKYLCAVMRFDIRGARSSRAHLCLSACLCLYALALFKGK